MKYVIIRIAAPQEPIKYIPVIFGDILTHKEVFDNVRSQLREQLKIHNAFITAKSAGFVDITTCNCYGRSESLDIGAADGDKLCILAGGI